MVDAWGDCQEQQGRPQWAIMQSEGNENQQSDNTEQKAHPEGADTDRTIPKRAQC